MRLFCNDGAPCRERHGIRLTPHGHVLLVACIDAKTCTPPGSGMHLYLYVDCAISQHRLGASKLTCLSLLACVRLMSGVTPWPWQSPPWCLSHSLGCAAITLHHRPWPKQVLLVFRVCRCHVQEHAEDLFHHVQKASCDRVDGCAGKGSSSQEGAAPLSSRVPSSRCQGFGLFQCCFWRIAWLCGAAFDVRASRHAQNVWSCSRLLWLDEQA